MSTMDPTWDGPGFRGRFPFERPAGPGPRRRRGRRPFPPDAMASARPPGPPDDGPGPHPGPGGFGRGPHVPGPGGPPFGPGRGGPPFRPGGPGPGWFRGPRGRRRGRPRGDVRAAVLALVAERPRHGYEIIQEIAERSGGAWRPSPGSVYPTLSQLEDEGLVRVEQTDGRRVVHLTEAGTEHVGEHREELDAVWAAVGREAGETGPDLWAQLHQLHAAAQQVQEAGTPEQVEKATAAVAEARRTIYRLLAE